MEGKGSPEVWEYQKVTQSEGERTQYRMKQTHLDFLCDGYIEAAKQVMFWLKVRPRGFYIEDNQENAIIFEESTKAWVNLQWFRYEIKFYLEDCISS